MTKTALAVHAAHQLAEGFPDGQVFLPLHGHTPGHQPVDAADALASLLQSSGIPVQAIPDGLEPRAALWRDRLAGRRMLLVLDNAASSGQVAPLLPGDGESLVLVTSRRHLGDLPGAVTLLLLDVLSPSQAVQMFARLAPRAVGKPGEVAEVVRLAGFLPLAISLLARLFTRHRSWTLADLTAETRLGLLTLTAEHDSVAAAFEVSYRHLDPALQRFFCLLGLHPGAAFEPYAAAALAGTGLDEAAGLLDALHREGLLTETGRRRYGMHDLLRSYARDHAAGFPGSAQAVERLLDYYQYTAARAEALIAFSTRPGSPPVTPAELSAAPALQDTDQALAWVRAERASLLACIDAAARTGQHARVIALTAGIAELLFHDGPWADAIARHTAAAQAASHLGDQLSRANAFYDIGFVKSRRGDLRGGIQVLEQALEIYRNLGDRLGQANVLWRRWEALQWTDDFKGGTRAIEQALEMYRDLGDRLGQANALLFLGGQLRLTGDSPGSVEALDQALEIYRDLGHRTGEADTLISFGIARRKTGDYPGAAQALEQALHIYRDVGTRIGEAAALLATGELYAVRGEITDAEGCYVQALELARAMFSSWDEARAPGRAGPLRPGPRQRRAGRAPAKGGTGHIPAGRCG